MAWKDEDGYLWFVGRADDIIKTSGYKVGPFEVESALIQHPAVLECAITGAPDPVRGQVIKATVVLTKGYTPGDALKKELQEHVKRVTAPYKYPRIIDFVEELPKTISGKIRRVEIRHKDQGLE
jgi:acetyl-CoA synthetase